MSFFTGVEVYRSLVDLTAKDRAWCVANTTSVYTGALETFNDTGLTDNTAYWYKIFSVYDSSGISIYSVGVTDSILTGSLLFGEYELLADITVSSATSSVDITGLNITSDDEILLVIDYNRTLAGGTIVIYSDQNGALVTTSSSYWAQYTEASGTSVATARLNLPFLIFASASNKASALVNIKLTESGHFTYQSSTSYDVGLSSITLIDSYGTANFTTNNISKLRIRQNDGGEALGVGSRFQLYRKGTSA